MMSDASERHMMTVSDRELPFHPDRAALLVIDMTNDFIERGAPYECAQARALIPEINQLLVKRRYSAFRGTDLENFPRRRGVDSVIVTGVATHSCCEATARGALFRDFAVYFVSDATATVGPADAGWGAFSPDEVQRFALTDIAHFVGRVGTTDELAALLAG